ncbi:MAG: molybdopterin molybdenumtransferase MoeA [Desulfuromonas sp.]|nr:MAG: molybdopterin molybdenumtransferase MoeA [Desulfuromonas sp.]
MISYAEALASILASTPPLPSCSLPLEQATGQVLAETVTARWDMPPWDNSAMDGFALAQASLAGETPLPVVGQSFAGHPWDKTLAAGEAIQITTGAPMPAGADTVIPLEDCRLEDQQLIPTRPVKPGQHVRYRGEEFFSGDTLLNAGTELRAGAVVLLAAAGISRVSVIPRPRVAVFSTGDELVELGQELQPGQIINSNLPYLCARLRECGCDPMPLGIGTDRCENLADLINRAREADLILSTGGVSVGERDLVQDTLMNHGFDRKFWKVRIKPGKPVLFGLLDGKPCFGLPGNPASTAITFELFVLPALRQLAGLPPTRQPLRATLTHDLRGGGNRQNFLWARCRWQEDGLMAEVPQRQASGQARSIQGANAIANLPIGSPPLAAGETIEIIPLHAASFFPYEDR